MARKWSNLNLPGALHFVTGNFLERTPVFTEPACCSAFLEELRSLNQKWPSKLIAYVLMPDHFHLVSNPRDGRIRELVGALKSLSAKSLVRVSKQFRFQVDADGHQVWQEGFKAIPLWSGWMIWQKINYIHANPVKPGFCSQQKTNNGPPSDPFIPKTNPPLPSLINCGGQNEPTERLRQLKR